MNRSSKIGFVFVLVAAVIVGTSVASAGRSSSHPVRIDSDGAGGWYVSGTMRDARASADPNEEIGCLSDAIPGLPGLVFCWAETSALGYKSCIAADRDETSYARTAAAISDTTLVSFEIDRNGMCKYLSAHNSSVFSR
jgi:hypothetical protein